MAPPDLQSLEQDLRNAGFRGEFDWDAASRAATSTDNSVYQIEPLAVAAPLDGADTARLMLALSSERHAQLTVTPRGGGTGTNGQSLNDGIVVDFHRHMNRILDVNADELWADVEPGIVLTELNEALAAHDLFFAPSTSTANRCTIGGMVSTDASGKGSRKYGKTSDNIIGLTAVLADGQVLDSLARPLAGQRRLLDAIAAHCDAGLEDFRAHVPLLPRRFTGYDLTSARPDPTRLDWWRLFMGAEGTLGLVTRIRLQLRRRSRHRVLVALAFDSVADALQSAETLLQFDPLAIELIDERIAGLAAEAGYLARLPAALHPAAGASLAYDFVEFAGDDPEALADTVIAFEAAAAALPGLRALYSSSNPAEMDTIWNARAASVGLLGKVGGNRRPVAFVEDCVVPIQNLVPFVRDFAGLLRAHGLTFGMYGHVDVGCLHIRPALNIDDEADRALFGAISDDIFALTRRHGGILWGEHGKGIRGQYLKDFVGPDAYAAFIGIKAALDPHGRLNAGKLVPVDAEKRGILSAPFRQMNAAPNDALARAFLCNGNAQCQSYERAAPMCPSFKATRDFRHSPKGRADILRAWRKATLADEPVAAALEAETFAALDLCLGCKSCATACPMQVDIPEMKAHFLEDYYTRHTRPLSDRVLIAMERFSGVISRFRNILAPLARLASAPLGAMLGLVDLPALESAGPFEVIAPGAIDTLQPAKNSVFVLQDPFTGLFETQATADVVAGLTRLGYAPLVLPVLPGGKAAHVMGDLPTFRREATAMTALLDRIAVLGVPVVGVDPAFVAMFAQEYRSAGCQPQAPVLSLQQFLAVRAAAGDPWPRLLAAPAELYLHCTESVAFEQVRADWAMVFGRLGLEVEMRKTGCCGMAGVFGHRQKNLALSRRIFDLSWSGTRGAARTVYATGFSCRSQVGRMAGQSCQHPAAMIAGARIVGMA